MDSRFFSKAKARNFPVKNTTTNVCFCCLLGHNLKMEDEDDDFNNKYLSDLKEGKCVLPTEKKANASDRLSELAWRNSMCPPHLKSSYPAELQFVSPSCFKEDEIKVSVDILIFCCKILRVLLF